MRPQKRARRDYFGVGGLEPFWRPERESNPRLILRRDLFYPLNYPGAGKASGDFQLNDNSAGGLEANRGIRLGKEREGRMMGCALAHGDTTGSTDMSFVYLAGAILLEVAGTICMKLSEGFTRLGPSLAIPVFYLASLACLTMALRKLEVSMVYAIWSGVGTALVAAFGIWWFEEALNTVKMVSILLIILGVVGLNLSGGVH